MDKRQEESLRKLNDDGVVIGEQATKFLQLVYPAYLVNQSDIEKYLDEESAKTLENVTFFRITGCTIDNVDREFDFVGQRFQKLFTALHSISVPIAYGIISQGGITNLVLGVYGRSDVDSVLSIMRGMLSGIELEPIKPAFRSSPGKSMSQGILAGVPSLYVNDDKQHFSLSSIMRGLNGQNYSLLFFARPVERQTISQNVSELISVRDRALAVSKRSIARSTGYAESQTDSTSTTDTEGNIAGQIGGAVGTGVGAVAGALFGEPALGIALGGGLGAIIGNMAGGGRSHSDGLSESISRTITEGEVVSGEIQNGYALELMSFTNFAIERLKAGQNNGIWETAIAFSAPKESSRNIISACLCGELSKLDAERLPMLAFYPNASDGESLRIPNLLGDATPNPLCSYLNSAELGLLCTVPTESVPDFELRFEKIFPLIARRASKDTVNIGNVADGMRSLENMPFSLSELDLNKHCFVCGITGSGKTTTVKKILIEAKKPFLVIESAKKEYRNLATETEIYTLGKPEINAPQINPFYIMPGVSPQVHIDYLKDLFNASFSFYGPMPFILEKCLHSIYENRGWNLTLGFHPLLVNNASKVDFFSAEHVRKQYSVSAHKFLFPTMQELKDEIARYIDDELKYDGDVAGNVKTAMKIRLESLCVGAKGYTFNTSDCINFSELLEKNVVFELEGLADDSDKAFSVGLLLILINEFRQTQKEASGIKPLGLQHLLVIEEAHRLLKNVDTDRSTETIGNPKGKAVEHFAHIVAEMRSFGQGVIVAEQIPTKLAPDVIKNTSTKIAHRIVSGDDQRIVANTIGITESDAVQLGFLRPGYAYCHKEGMALPTLIRVSNHFTDYGNEEQELDVFVTDELLFNKYNDRNIMFQKIDLSLVRSLFSGSDMIKGSAIAFLNTMMCEDARRCGVSCTGLVNAALKELRINGVQLLHEGESYRTTSCILAETILSMMVRGVYCTHVLPDEQFLPALSGFIYSPDDDKALDLKRMMTKMYAQDVARFAKDTVAALVRRRATEATDIPCSIRKYFLEVSDETVQEIQRIVGKGFAR